MLFGAVLFFHGSGPWIGLIGFAIVLYVMYCWWKDVVHEGQTGDHTPIVQIGLRYGVVPKGLVQRLRRPGSAGLGLYF